MKYSVINSLPDSVTCPLDSGIWKTEPAFGDSMQAPAVGAPLPPLHLPSKLKAAPHLRTALTLSASPALNQAERK